MTDTYSIIGECYIILRLCCCRLGRSAGCASDLTVSCLVLSCRNGSMLQEWLVDEYILGSNGVGNDNISGVFIDECE